MNQSWWQNIHSVIPSKPCHLSMGSNPQSPGTRGEHSLVSISRTSKSSGPTQMKIKKTQLQRLQVPCCNHQRMWVSCIPLTRSTRERNALFACPKHQQGENKRFFLSSWPCRHVTTAIQRNSPITSRLKEDDLCASQHFCVYSQWNKGFSRCLFCFSVSLWLQPSRCHMPTCQ